MAGHYRQLIAWQKAIDFVDAVYDATSAFPKDERFELTSQVRRAVVSIASNIAEGQGRKSRNDFIRFLRQAHGSLCEVETQLIIAKRRRYISEELCDRLLKESDELSRIISGLAKALKEREDANL